jgi:methylaspartate mutase sigma subunit
VADVNPLGGAEPEAHRWRLVLGVIGSDPHSVGNRVLARALADAGYQVFNLGAMVPPEEFIAAAKEAAAHAILISSLSGFGEVYAREIRVRCREAGLGDIVVYMGGNVVNGPQPWDEVEREFTAFGIDRVYPPQTRVERLLPDLARDLEARYGSPGVAAPAPRS